MTAKSTWALDKAQNKVATHNATGQRLVAAVGDVHSQRFRKTIAEVNAGVTLLAALVGFKYRLVDCLAISIGGAAGAVTTVDVIGTQTSAVKLCAFAQANLTQSTVLRPGVTGCTVLADGASFVANDANTAITAGITGSSITTATHIDFILTYSIDEA